MHPDDSPSPLRSAEAGRSLPAFVRFYRWATHRLYHELAWAYDAVSWLVSAGRWDGWRRLALDYVHGKRVLEVGFGTGELLIEMARRGLDPYGLELSPAMLRVTRRKMDRLRLAVPRVHGAVQEIPFRDGFFDTILSTFPAEYIMDPRTLREFARVLRPAGRLVVVGLTVTVNNRWLGRLLPLFYGRLPEHVVLAWQKAAAASGLRTTLLARKEGQVTLPILIAEKMT